MCLSRACVKFSAQFWRHSLQTTLHMVLTQLSQVWQTIEPKMGLQQIRYSFDIRVKYSHTSYRYIIFPCMTNLTRCVANLTPQPVGDWWDKQSCQNLKGWTKHPQNHQVVDKTPSEPPSGEQNTLNTTSGDQTPSYQVEWFVGSLGRLWYVTVTTWEPRHHRVVTSLYLTCAPMG